MLKGASHDSSYAQTLVSQNNTYYKFYLRLPFWSNIIYKLLKKEISSNIISMVEWYFLESASCSARLTQYKVRPIIL